MSAETAILQTLASHGMWQRIDGLRCEQRILHRSIPFFRFRLRLMEWEGLIECKALGGFWASTQGMPWFKITEAGRSAAIASLTTEPRS